MAVHMHNESNKEKK